MISFRVIRATGGAKNGYMLPTMQRCVLPIVIGWTLICPVVDPKLCQSCPKIVSKLPLDDL